MPFLSALRITLLKLAAFRLQIQMAFLGVAQLRERESKELNPMHEQMEALSYDHHNIAVIELIFIGIYL